MYAVEFSLRIKSLFCRPSVPEKSKSSLKGLEERIGRLWHPMTRKLLDMAFCQQKLPESRIHVDMDVM